MCVLRRVQPRCVSRQKEGTTTPVCFGSSQEVEHLNASGQRELRKPIFLMFRNKVPQDFLLKTDFPENQNHTGQALFPAGQSDADFEF